MVGLPAASLDALLAGFDAVGLDTAVLRSAWGLPVDGSPGDRACPQALWHEAWDHAWRQRPEPTLALAVGLAVPFGRFGMVDYLAGSAATLRGGLRALSDHFATVTDGVRLVFDELPDGGTLRVVNLVPATALDDEFALATSWGRFRTLAVRPLALRTLATRRPPPEAPQDFSRCVGSPVTFGADTSHLAFHTVDLDVGLKSADPGLHRTLTQLASALGLGATGSDLVSAIRSRFRALLPDGRAEATHVARSLGMSERTLHRRLQAEGTSYQAVLDGYRVSESERLLRRGDTGLAAIALAVGFSDQTAWTRAFKRWRGTSPTAWRDAQPTARGRPSPR